MNFLAHCLLAADLGSAWQCDDSQRCGLVAGAVLGDFVKGPVPQDWPSPLAGGVRLHRKIDALSNRNPHMLTCSRRFPDHLRRLAPIFVDILADHHLAHHWSKHASVPLPTFSQQCYRYLATYEKYLPENGRRFFDYMREVDLLADYHRWATVELGLLSVLRRLRRKHLADEVVTACQRVAVEGADDLDRLLTSLGGECLDWNVLAVSAEPQN